MKVVPTARVILIAAVSEDGFISAGTGVPWDLPRDREHFRSLTAGKCLLLGRRTFDEMRGWFRDHRPLVLTRRALPEPWQDAAVASVEEAAQRAGDGDGELWVCGGASVYAAALPLADELILTRVHERLGGGVPFPAINPAEWRETQRKTPPADSVPRPAFEWVWMRRR